ncbi:hypothetical protein V1508DRAFT_67375 [Lipomyces doorenjongii]|uniref:uncharacterized protein n=1 Tax=Lipomyces doorenjongii TaxID=383834 RepID=UPI0034CE66BE
MGVILNLPPSVRCHKENPLLFGTVPGPKIPKDIFPFSIRFDKKSRGSLSMA